ADERPCNDSPDAQRVEEAARNRANLVKPLEPEHLLMGSYLKNAVHGRVTDGFSRSQMLLAENFDNDSSRGVAVAENPRQMRLFAKGIYDLGRKAGTILRKIAPLERHG